MNTGRQNQRTIFLLEEDDDTRTLLRQSLQACGYRVLIAVDEEDALERVAGGHVHADLILVDVVGKPAEEALEFGRGLRERAKFDGATPLIVMAEKYGKDLEGTDLNVGGNDWITYPEDAEQFHNLIAALIEV